MHTIVVHCSPDHALMNTNISHCKRGLQLPVSIITRSKLIESRELLEEHFYECIWLLCCRLFTPLYIHCIYFCHQNKVMFCLTDEKMNCTDMFGCLANELHYANCCCMFESVMLSACRMCPQFQPARSSAMLPLCMCLSVFFYHEPTSLYTPPPLLLHTYIHTPVPPPFTQTTVKPIQPILRSAERAVKYRRRRRRSEREGEKRGDTGKHKKREAACAARAGERREI